MRKVLAQIPYALESDKKVHFGDGKYLDLSKYGNISINQTNGTFTFNIGGFISSKIETVSIVEIGDVSIKTIEFSNDEGFVLSVSPARIHVNNIIGEIVFEKQIDNLISDIVELFFPKTHNFLDEVNKSLVVPHGIWHDSSTFTFSVITRENLCKSRVRTTDDETGKYISNITIKESLMDLDISIDLGKDRNAKNVSQDVMTDLNRLLAT